MARSLKRMKAGKACSEDGLVAEMLQAAPDHLLEMLALLFSDLLSGRGGMPEDWKTNRLIVLFKKGDASLPKNYRPIMILPVLSKLFSGILLERMSEKLEEKRTPEEMGFRKRYSCSDLIHTLRMMGERAMEFGETIWMASLDLEKAFDKVLHAAVFDALDDAEVDSCTVSAVRALYSNNKACIRRTGGANSRVFDILRGVRQGDPLSPALFTNAVRVKMQSLKRKWEQQKYGTIVGSNSECSSRITYAMFADDTTLIARSRRTLRLMIHDICTELSSIGLNVNADKCCIQHTTRMGKASVDVDGQRFPVVPREEGFKVLGVQFTLDGCVRREFDLRMKAAYGKFNSLFELLTKRDANVKKRLLLFQSTVTQTALWCSESWTLTVAQKRHLRAVQRRFLRQIAGPRRAPDQEYIPWIKQSTKQAEVKARDAGVECWLTDALRRKWVWAGKLVRAEPERLARRCTVWRDSEWWTQQPRGASAYGARPMRAKPGHFSRWENDLINFSRHQGWASWQVEARCEETWMSMTEQFVSFTWR